MTQRREDRPERRACDWCGEEFTPLSYRHHFCSSGCATAHGNSLARHECGPCPTCGAMFRSRSPGKKYCRVECYIDSDQFQAMRRQNLENLNPTLGTPRVCKGCGAEYPRSRRAKFCTKACRRKYFAERFDRWVANPESVALPQNFDEFLARNVLTCPVTGCEWEGTFLGAHVNFAHGISARDFKKLAGFNLTSGLVGAELSEFMSAKARRLVEQGLFFRGAEECRPPAEGDREVYISLERKEAAKKSRAELPPYRDAWLPCRTCGAEVRQPTMGRKLYCSIPCRTKYYQDHAVGEAPCAYCGKSFECNRVQANRHREGKPVCCSQTCRNRLNVARALAVRGIVPA